MGLKEIVERRSASGYKKIIFEDDNEDRRVLTAMRPRRMFLVKRINRLKLLRGIKVSSHSKRRLRLKYSIVILSRKLSRLYAEMVSRMNMEGIVYPTIVVSSYWGFPLVVSL